MFKKLLIVLAVTLAPVSTMAADFSVIPAGGRVGIQEEFSVNVKIDTAGASINAAQAKIKFNPAIVSVKSLSKDGSVFDFWLEGPTFSNDTGIIEFIGGTPNGISGSSLQALKITFVPKGLGTVGIEFVDSTINAADGSGTNILSKSTGSTFTIGSSKTTPTTGEPGSQYVIPTPAQITRTPAPASGLPKEPELKVTLYPDPAAWYNRVAPFNVAWNLPGDISGVSTLFNTNPSSEAPARSEGLFDNKTFPAIEKDGINYVHIRFQNSKGWGPTAHYKISVDTAIPLPFVIDVKSGTSSDNPTPLLNFNTGDALSGVDHYRITIDNNEPIISVIGEFTLPPQRPGVRQVAVAAIDKAGNSIESKTEIEIIPLDTPTINSMPEVVYRDTDRGLKIVGAAIPNVDVLVSIIDKDNNSIVRDEARSDVDGAWVYELERDLRNGKYQVTVQARDDRGAVSLSSSPKDVSFKDVPILSIFGVDITFSDLVVILALAVVITFGFFTRKFSLHASKTRLTSSYIGKDLSNILTAIKRELSLIDTTSKSSKTTEGTKNIAYLNSIKNISTNIDKIERYVKKDLEKVH